MSKLRAYCELVRLPNGFTAVADVMAGYWLVSAEWRPSLPLVLLMTASAALYSAGIVFNDLADVETDRRERPGRPLPSGKIGLRSARRLGIVLGLGGIALAALGGAVAPGGTTARAMHTGAVSTALFAAILTYDFVLKSTGAGPLLMGSCRALNLALGMVGADWLRSDARGIALVAMFVYVASISYFGRDEAGLSRRSRMIPSGVGMIASILLLGLLLLMNLKLDMFTIVLWLALLIHIARVTLRAIRRPVPEMVQYAMKTYILGIIAFDAIIASAVHGWPAGVTVLGLLVPALVVGRWVYST